MSEAIKNVKEGFDYNGIHLYDVAVVKELDTVLQVVYLTVSTVPWVTGETNFIPVNPLSANVIRDYIQQGKEVYIDKNWMHQGKEVLPGSIQTNISTDLDGYKKRAYSFIKSFINPMMANVHASTIYGFITLNNKFLERGIVFSEENKSLKYIEIMDDASEQEDPNKSEEIMSNLEQYIEYKDILDRSYFIWNESEKYMLRIEEIAEDDFTDHNDETIGTALLQAKKTIDSIVKEFQQKILTLNNLK